MTNTVLHRFLCAADKYPDSPAIWAKGRHFKYSELSALAEATRQALEKAGAHHAARIGVMTGDNVAPYASILAVLAQGSAYVPLNSKNPAARNLGIIDDAGITALVYDTPSELTERLASSRGGRCKLVEFPAAASASGAPLRFQGGADNALAYLFFTSGSTGKPKGVPISHGNLNHFMSVMLDEEIYDFRAEDRFLQMFELTFDLSVMSLFVPLSIGACCYVVPDSRVAAATTLQVMQEHDISVALMVPSLLVYLEPYLARVSLPSLRLSMFCGEALPDSLVQKWHRTALHSSIENVYGPTEATIFCLRYPWDATRSPDEAVNGIVPIGRALPGTGALVVDEQANIVSAPGITGELMLTGPQLFAGYWKDDQKSAAAFATISGADKPLRGYRTGDVCSINGRGDLLYHGRLDSQVKIDGHRVELGEIEHRLREVLDRTNLAVIVAADRDHNALWLFTEGTSVDMESLSRELRLRLPDYMIPKRVQCVDRLPLNLNGKIDRATLRSMIQARSKSD